jgi:hypothetical protein
MSGAEPLAPLDAAFVALETPVMPLHVVAVAVLDAGARPLTVHQLRRRVAERLVGQRRLWQRVERVPFGLDHPRWVDDPDVDLDHHVRRTALPAPGGPAELHELVADLAGRPLDPARPLWELLLVEGLEDRHVALAAKVHHALFDGVAGLAVLAGLFDGDPDGRPFGGRSLDGAMADPGTEAAGATGADGFGVGGATGVPGTEPRGATGASGIGAARATGPLDLVTSVVRRWARRPLALGDAIAGTYVLWRSGDVASTVPSGRSAPVGQGASVGGASLDGTGPGDGSGPIGQGSVPGPRWPFQAPRAPWNGAITAQRRCTTVRLSLTELQTVAATLGGTVNDVLVAAVSAALRRAVVRDQAGPGVDRSVDRSGGGGSDASVPGCPELVAGIPVSVRRPRAVVVPMHAALRHADPEDAAGQTATGDPVARGHQAVSGDWAGGGNQVGVGNHVGGGNQVGVGNQVAAAVVPLATDEADVSVRYHRIVAATTAAKAWVAGLPDPLVPAWAELAVPALSVRLARLVGNLRLFDHVPPPVNVVVSNLIGPSTPLWLDGRPLVELVPFGPVLDGAGINVTAVSYRGTLVVGIAACPRRVRDVDTLASDLVDGVTELVKAAQARRGRAAR